MSLPFYTRRSIENGETHGNGVNLCGPEAVGIKSGGAFIANFVASRWSPPPPVAYIKAQKYGDKTNLQRAGIWARFYLCADAPRSEVRVTELPENTAVHGRRVLLVDGRGGAGSALRRAREELVKLGARGVQTFVVAAASAKGRRQADYCGEHRFILVWPWGIDA